MNISNPYVKLRVKLPPETITSELAHSDNKAKARYPSGSFTSKPGGGGKTSGPFRRALTPGGSY